MKQLFNEYDSSHYISFLMIFVYVAIADIKENNYTSTESKYLCFEWIWKGS